MDGGVMVSKIKGDAQSTFGGTILATAPAFRAYLNTQASLSNNTWTKIEFDVEDFDTDSCYDNTTNYRFTPTVEGYYQVNFRVRPKGTSSTVRLGALYKNGSIASYANVSRESTSSDMGVNGGDIIYMNGSTDYIEVYSYLTATGSHIIQTGSNNTFFSAVLVRAV
jgi:hypothetical protein